MHPVLMTKINESEKKQEFTRCFTTFIFYKFNYFVLIFVKVTVQDYNTVATTILSPPMK